MKDIYLVSVNDIDNNLRYKHSFTKKKHAEMYVIHLHNNPDNLVHMEKISLDCIDPEYPVWKHIYSCPNAKLMQHDVEFHDFIRGELPKNDIQLINGIEKRVVAYVRHEEEDDEVRLAACHIFNMEPYPAKYYFRLTDGKVSLTK